MLISRPAGGLSRLDLGKARLSVWSAKTVGAWALVLLLGAARPVWVVARGGWSAVGMVVALAATGGGLLLVWGGGRANEAGPRFARRIPELAEAAARAAQDVGVRPPSVVGLHPYPLVTLRVHTFPRRRVVLLVGLPLLMTLSADDLRVVIAHELAVLSEPHPAAALAVSALRDRWTGAPAAVAAGSTKRRLHRAARFIERTAEFGAELESRADQAAVLSAGSREQAAAALLRAALVMVSLHQYAATFDRLIVKYRHIPAELYTGWLENAGPAYPLTEDRQAVIAGVSAEVREWHSDLAGAFPEDIAWPIAGGVRSVRDVAGAKAERRMAFLYGKSKVSGNQTVRPVPWEKINPDKVFWPVPGSDEFIDAASAVLGHAATALDVVELLAGDGRGAMAAELTRAQNLDDPAAVASETSAEDLCPGVAAVDAITYELRAHGYRHRSVRRLDQLTAPDGSVVDVGQVVVAAFTAADGVDRLRDLLATARQGAQAAPL